MEVGQKVGAAQHFAIAGLEMSDVQQTTNNKGQALVVTFSNDQISGHGAPIDSWLIATDAQNPFFCTDDPTTLDNHLVPNTWVERGCVMCVRLL